MMIPQEKGFSYLDDGEIRAAVSRFLTENDRDADRMLAACLAAVGQAETAVNRFDRELKEALSRWKDAGKNVKLLLRSFSEQLPNRNGFFGSPQTAAELSRSSVGMLIAFDDKNRVFREQSASVSHMEGEFSLLSELLNRAEGRVAVGKSAFLTLGKEEPTLIQYADRLAGTRSRLQEQIEFLTAFCREMITYFSVRSSFFGSEIAKSADIDNGGKDASLSGIIRLTEQMNIAVDTFLKVT